MESITLKKCEDGTIWVTSDEDQNGTESSFVIITDEKVQMMYALAEFLGFEPSDVLTFKSIQESDEEEEEEEEEEEGIETRYDSKTIGFVSSAGVYRVKNFLEYMIHTYGIVTVADLREHLYKSVTTSDYGYGWVDLSKFVFENNYITGYYVRIPKALPLSK